MVFASLLALFLLAGFGGAETIKVSSGESVQAAIERANPGDVVLVQSGTYHENLDVTKRLTLRGMDTGSGIPIIEGNGNDTAIRLKAGGIILKNFEVAGSRIGIEVVSDNNFVTKNVAKDNWVAISIVDSTKNLVKDNTILDNYRGIYLESSFQNTISKNSVSDNRWFGIGLQSSERNVITGNTISNNYYGLSLAESEGNTVKNNVMTGNKYDDSPLLMAPNSTETEAEVAPEVVLGAVPGTDEIEGDETVILEVARDEAGNETLIREVAEAEAGNETLIREVARDEAGNETLIREVAEAEAGNETLIREVAEAETGNETLIREVAEAETGNETLVREVAETKTGNETLIREGAEAETAVDTRSKSSSKKSSGGTAIPTVTLIESKTEEKSETELEMPAPTGVNETILLNETLLFNETAINKTLVPNGTILLNETLLFNETAINKTLVPNGTILLNETLLFNETAINKTLVPNGTILLNETLPFNETVINETLVPNETIFLNETLPLNETLANETALANETGPVVSRIGDENETGAEDGVEDSTEGEVRTYRNRSNARVLYEYLKSLVKDVTGGAPEPAKPPVNVSKIVEEELSDLDLGQINFNVSQEMTLGVTERIEVAVSTDIDQRLRERLKAREELQGEDVNIETYMETALKGTHFYIKSKNLDIQAAEGEGFTQWEWEVTPLKSGDQNLSLAILAVVEVPEWVEVRREYPAFEEVSEVEVSLPKMVIYILDQVSDVRRMVFS